MDKNPELRKPSRARPRRGKDALLPAQETAERARASGSFLIKVIDTRNATWQGTITLIDKRATRAAKFPQPISAGGGAYTLSASRDTIPFRSVLELLRLIDSALEQGEGIQEVNTV